MFRSILFFKTHSLMVYTTQQHFFSVILRNGLVKATGTLRIPLGDETSVQSFPYVS